VFRIASLFRHTCVSSFDEHVYSGRLKTEDCGTQKALKNLENFIIPAEAQLGQASIHRGIRRRNQGFESGNRVKSSGEAKVSLSMGLWILHQKASERWNPCTLALRCYYQHKWHGNHLLLFSRSIPASVTFAPSTNSLSTDNFITRFSNCNDFLIKLLKGHVL